MNLGKGGNQCSPSCPGSASDTDRTAKISAPKANPADIAKIAIDGIEADSCEILADDLSRKVQKDLAGGVAVLYPQLFQDTRRSYIKMAIFENDTYSLSLGKHIIATKEIAL